MRRMRLLRSTSLLLAAPCLLAGTALPQGAVPLVMQGDNLPGIGNVQTLLRVWVNSSGEWLAEVDTDAPAGTDRVLVLNGTPFLREGDPVADPGGATWVIGDVAFNEAGQVLVAQTLLGTPGGTDQNHGVYLDGDLLALEGDAVTAPQAAVGTEFRAFDAIDLTDAGFGLLTGFYDDPTIQGASDDFLMRIEKDATGAIVDQQVLGFETQIAPGTGATINQIRKRQDESAVGGCGDVLWGADLDGDVATDGVVYFNQTLIAREGSPAPSGGVWGPIDAYVSDVNDAGDWLFSDHRADNSRLIVINGEAVIEEGDLLADIAPFPLETIGAFHAVLDDTGSVLWHGGWDDGPGSAALFVDEQIVVKTGETQVNGTPIQGLSNSDQVFSISPNGRFVVFRGSILGGGTGFFRLDLGIGTPYCTSGENSSGFASTIYATGTLSIADNDLVLTADNLPANQTGLVYFGPKQLQAPFGNGTRCVGGPNVHRLPMQSASKSGILSQRVDYQSPQVGGDIVSGSTWNFQAWFRDTQGGGAGFDLSDAVSLTFVP